MADETTASIIPLWHLQRLCEAEAVVEYSDEHRQSMLGRIADLFHEGPVQSTIEAAE